MQGLINSYDSDGGCQYFTSQPPSSMPWKEYVATHGAYFEGGISSIGADWFYGMGEFYYSTSWEATMQPSQIDGGTSAQICFVVNIFDRYDWDPDPERGIRPFGDLVFIPNSRIGALHRWGLAQEFIMLGVSDWTFCVDLELNI